MEGLDGRRRPCQPGSLGGLHQQLTLTNCRGAGATACHTPATADLKTTYHLHNFSLRPQTLAVEHSFRPLGPR